MHDTLIRETLVPAASSLLTMRAAILTAPRQVEVQRAPIPQPSEGMVRIRLEGCGVCASNVPPWEGREWFSYPMPPGHLGHEGWGIIDEPGEGVTSLEPGQRVTFFSSNAYAQYDLAPVGQVVPLPASLAGMPFPAEPLACAMNIIHRADIAAGNVVAVVGIGFLGALLTRLAAEHGASVIALARRSYCLDIARRFGAAHCVVMDDHWRAIGEVRRITGERLCDVVIEATGKQWPLDLAAELTRERGRLLIAGYHQDGPRQVNMQLWNWRGLDVISAHERDPAIYLRGMREAVGAVASGILDPTSLYTHSFCLEQLGEALDMAARRPDGFMKAIIRM